MEILFVKLSNTEDVKEFVDIIKEFEGDFDLAEGRYVIDAKSIMGVLSMNLSSKLQLIIHQPTPELLERIKKFVVD